jgi:hypothetical protein
VPYDVNSDSYRERIRGLLDHGDEASLLYAALELRCAVEGRMKEYLDPLDHIPKAHKKEYSVVKLGKTVDGAFQLVDQVCLFTICFGDGAELPLRYIPVPKRLQAIAARAGDVLHFSGETNSSNPNWWKSLRTTLEEGYSWFAFVATGDLLGLPLLNRKTRQANVRAFLLKSDPRSALLERLSQGGKHRILVAYEPLPKEPPQ